MDFLEAKSLLNTLNPLDSELRNVSSAFLRPFHLGKALWEHNLAKPTSKQPQVEKTQPLNGYQLRALAKGVSGCLVSWSLNPLQFGPASV